MHHSTFKALFAVSAFWYRWRVSNPRLRLKRALLNHSATSVYMVAYAPWPSASSPLLIRQPYRPSAERLILLTHILRITYFGAPSLIRTDDLGITSASHYLLCYGCIIQGQAQLDISKIYSKNLPSEKNKWCRGSCTIPLCLLRHQCYKTEKFFKGLNLNQINNTTFILYH